MKKISILLLTIIFLVSSCQKSDEYNALASSKAKFVNEAYLKNKPNAEIRDCFIEKMAYAVGIKTSSLLFKYNSSGDPTSITRTSGAATGYPHFVFKYDHKKRLTDFIGVYNESLGEFWHRYFYNSRGNIVLDSTYIFPFIASGFPTNSYKKQVTYFTYDNKDRIIKDSSLIPGISTPVVHIYTYDTDGNKTGFVYDDQININRTNKVWMFLNRDYSVNNPFRSNTYTTSGLPKNFNLSSQGGYFNFLNNAYNEAQITYSCSGN